MLEAEISPAGTVTVEGHHVGELQGFRFTADQSAGGEDAKAVRAAAQKALAAEFEARADKFAISPNGDIALASDGILRWIGAPIGTLVAGEDPLRPRLILLADDQLSGAARDKVAARADRFVNYQIDSLLKPLVDLKGAEQIPGIGKGIAFRLVEEFGLINRRDIAEDVKSLDQEGRAALRKLGVRFGAYHVFVPALLKPGPASLVTLLWALRNDGKDKAGFGDIVHALAAGRTSVVVNQSFDRAFYKLAGFRILGRRAVRVDILERLADLIRPALAWRIGTGARPEGAWDGNAFLVTPAMMSILGATADDMEEILKGLGYRGEAKPAAEVKAKIAEIDEAAKAAAEARAAARAAEAAALAAAAAQGEAAESSEVAVDGAAADDATAAAGTNDGNADDGEVSDEAAPPAYVAADAGEVAVDGAAADDAAAAAGTNDGNADDGEVSDEAAPPAYVAADAGEVAVDGAAADDAAAAAGTNDGNADDGEVSDEAAPPAYVAADAGEVAVDGAAADDAAAAAGTNDGNANDGAASDETAPADIVAEAETSEAIVAEVVDADSLDGREPEAGDTPAEGDAPVSHADANLADGAELSGVSHANDAEALEAQAGETAPAPAERDEAAHKGEKSAEAAAAEEPKPIMLWRQARFEQRPRHRHGHRGKDGQRQAGQRQQASPPGERPDRSRDGEARPAGKQRFEKKFSGKPAKAADGQRPDRRDRDRDERKGGDGQKQRFEQRPREARAPRFDPDSPFAKLAALRDQLKK